MTTQKQTQKPRTDEEQMVLDPTWSAPKPRGRPKIHEDRKAACRAASAAYRNRKRARRSATEIEDRGVIDLSAVAPWKIKRR